MGPRSPRKGTPLAFLAFAIAIAIAGSHPAALAQSDKDQWDETLPGFKPGHLYDSSGIDNVNVFSGDPGISIPIGPAYPLASGLTWQLRAYYSAKYILYDSVPCPGDPPLDPPYVPTHSFVTGSPALGAGWTLELGYVGPDPTHKRALSMLAYHGPDGGSHTFSAGVTVDGSQLRLVMNPADLQCSSNPCYEVDFPDGVRHLFDQVYQRPVIPGSKDFNDEGYGFDGSGNPVAPRDRWGLTAIYDRFSNKVLEVAYDAAQPWKVSSVTLRPLLAPSSSVGFTWGSNVVNGVTFPVLTSLSLPTVGTRAADGTQTARTEQISFDFLPGGSNFLRPQNGSGGCPDGLDVRVPLLTSIVESDGVSVARSYQFAYGSQGTSPLCPNPSGESSPFQLITSVTLPTGGQINYEYGPTANRADQDSAPGLQEDNLVPDDPAYSFFQSVLDETPAVWWRKEWDPVTGLRTFTHYKRKHVLVANGTHDRRTFRQVIVTSLDGNVPATPGTCQTPSNSGQVSRRHMFTTPFDSQGGFEVERANYASLYDPLASLSPAPFRMVVRCFEGDQNEFFVHGPFCGWNDPNTVATTFDLFQNVRLQKEVTWYGSPAWASGTTGGSCSNDPVTPCFERILGTYAPNAYEYEDETITAANGLQSQVGFLSRTTHTSWARQASDPWLLKIFGSRTFSEPGALAPASVVSSFDMTTLRGFLTSASVSSGNRTLTTTYTPHGVSKDPISRTVALTEPSVPTSTFVDTRTFKSGLGLTSQRTGINWYSFNASRDDRTGLILSASDPNGLLTVFSYDPLRRLLSIEPPGIAKTDLVYASNTDVTESVTGPDGNGTWARYIYDGLGRLIREIRKMPGTDYAIRTHAFNEAGLAKKESEWAGCTSVAAGGNCLTDDPPGTVYSNFDPMGRARQVVRADASSTTVDFTDGSIAHSDTLETTTTKVNTGVVPGYAMVDAVTKTRKDVFGRIIAVTEPGGDVTNYRYNVLGKLAEVKQSQGPTTQTRSFVYDNFGFLASEDHPEKGTTQYQRYDALGNILIKADLGVDGVTSNYTYDAAGRLTTLTTGASGQTVYGRTCYLENLNSTDCPTSPTLVANPKGKVLREVGYNPAAFQAPFVLEDFDYAGPGSRMSLKTTTIKSGATTLLQATESWYYNSLGLERGHVRPRPTGDNRPFVVATEYDQGLPVREFLNGLKLVKSVVYHPAGALAGYTTGLGIGQDVTTATTFQAGLPRPAQIVATRLSDGGTPFDSGTYEYDASGNVCKIGIDLFGYDTRSRLLYASYPASPAPNTQTFAYDRFGNMLSRSGANGQTYMTDNPPSTNNHLTGYGYFRGNIKGPGSTTSHTWDDLDRMAGQATGPWWYAYTGGGERIGKLPQGLNWTFTLRDPQKRLETEFAGNVFSRDNVFLGNQIVASYANGDVSGNSWSWAFYSSDHLGTPRLSTSIDGVTAESHKYWPFGDEVGTATAYQRLRFAAMENDAEATRSYDHARHHDFSFARFLGTDRLTGNPEDAQSWNRYVYARNNPLLYVDPTGDYPLLIWAQQILQRMATHPATQRAMTWVGTQGTAAWNAATRFFNSSGGQAAVQAVADISSGSMTPSAVPTLRSLEGVLKPGGAKIGEELANSAIRGVVATKNEAASMFKQLVGSAPVKEVEGVLVAEVKGLGTIQLRDVSKTPGVVATIELLVKGLGVREVKFFKTAEDLLGAAR